MKTNAVSGFLEVGIIPILNAIGTTEPKPYSNVVADNPKALSRSEMEIRDIKIGIKEIFKNRKKAYISDLAEELNTPPSKVKRAVKELIDEGFLKD
ncbi:MAG: winged helix-turn-helix transcriptional regulator [Candidatus Micrarchaeota archaeon]|nr:winged helix-turn-helix transcriptional regulator [Candidatus Micrarchaeota archaeon]